MKPSPSDLEMFERIGVDRQLVESAGIVRVDDMGAREFGITLPGDMSGIVFPYYVPGENGHRATCRLRRDHPEVSNGKTENKYVCPEGDRKRLYFPPGAAELLAADPKSPIIFAEAEKSALAITAWAARVKHKVVAIATGGCWGWKSKTGIEVSVSGKRQTKTGPSPDLACAKGREVAILFDANALYNEDVQKARRAFAAALRKHNARVAIVELPEGDWNGPDDFIGANGDEAMVELFTKPSPTAPQPDVPGRLPITEASNAERFFKKSWKDFRHCSDRGVWAAWNGTHWAVNDLGAVMRKMQEVARDIYFEAARETFEDRRQQLAEWAQRSDSRRTQENSVALARFMQGIEVPKFSDVFDRKPLLLNVKSGTIDLTTGQLREHRRDDFLTKIVPVDYDEHAEPKNRGFDKFLNETFNTNTGLINYIQRVAGYFLTGLTTEQAWWMFHGVTASGKSTLVNILRGLLGPYALALPENFFLLTNKGTDYTKASLAGVRLATCVETNEGKRLDVARIKELTGGDVVSGEFKYQNSFEFRPEAKLVLVTNFAPHVPAGDDALWRRLKVLPFTTTVPKENQAPDLAIQLIEKEGPGILRWAVLGYLAWQGSKTRLSEPQEVESAIADYRNREDEIKEFLNEFCTTKDAVKPLLRKELYRQYVNWRKETNQKYVLGAIVFGRELSRIGIEGDEGKRHWKGIRLKALGDPEPEKDEWL